MENIAEDLGIKFFELFQTRKTPYSATRTAKRGDDKKKNRRKIKALAGCLTDDKTDRLPVPLPWLTFLAQACMALL